MTDFEKENLASKTRKSKKGKNWKSKDHPKTGNDLTGTVNILDDIASLQPGKNAQIAAKKISEKYKKNERGSRCQKEI